jgi:hypothetical protein
MAMRALTATVIGGTLGVSLAALAPSCSATSSSSTTGQGGGGLGFGNGGSGGLDPDAGCASYQEQAEAKPVNLYIMYDKSSSMAGNKWTAARAGLGSFVDDPASTGLSVALRFFPRDPDAVPECDQHAYSDPTVAFAPLPGNAAAIKAAIAAEAPDGFGTPMYPALGGALLEGIEVAENNPGEVSAVLLVTDGVPEGPEGTCGGVDPEDPAVIADLAAAALAFNPSVTTFVVGLPGVDQAVANEIAMAGGSESAILVGNTNVEAEFREALLAVRGQAVPCEYAVPAKVQNGEYSISTVNIQITPSGGEPYLLPQNQNCTGDGWYYDDPSNPTLILLCPETCAELKQDFGAAILVVLGCATIVS